MAFRQVLSSDGLEHVATHKYKSGVYTPLDNLLNPWWLWLTSLLPEWFAPNLVTLAGFLPMALSYVLSWYYSPDGVQPLPRWVTGSQALALFIYQTMDAMDGKQARRIGFSTPMGQLFDHGFDCLACLSHHCIAWAFVLGGSSIWVIAGLSIFQLAFFMGQWQERYTGVLVTNYGWVGVTETQYALMALSLAITLMGPELTQSISFTTVTVPWSGPTPIGIIVAQGWVLFNVGLMTNALIVVMPATIYGSKVCKEEEVCASKDGPPGKARLIRALCDLFPMVVLALLPFFWRQSLFARSPRMYCYLNGMLAFQYTAKIIVFTMARQKFPARQLSLIPYVAVVVVARFTPVEREGAFHMVMQLYTVVVTVNVWVWLFSAIQQLKEKLGIEVLTTKKPEKGVPKKSQ